MQEQHIVKHKPGSIPLSMMCVVCDKEKAEKVQAIMENQKAYFSLQLIGKGTANSKILNYLGLGEAEKRIYFSMLPATKAHALMKALDEKLQLDKPGHGVAAEVPIDIGSFRKPVEIAHEEDGGKTVEQAMHELIMVVVNRGYTEEVMCAARKAGATGGTVLHARGCGIEGAEKFFGVTIQPEKEMIMIISKSSVTKEIMKMIADEQGPGTDANAVSFSMPVTNVMGIGRDVPKEMV